MWACIIGDQLVHSFHPDLGPAVCVGIPLRRGSDGLPSLSGTFLLIVW